MLYHSKKIRDTYFWAVFISLFVSLIYLFVIWKVQYENKERFYILLSIDLLVAYSIFLVCTQKVRERKKMQQIVFPEEWRQILQQYVHYYQRLDSTEKISFEKEVQTFLHEVPITGIKTKVDDLSKVLTASAAIIPVFRFPAWEYAQLTEILIYPDLFNSQYSVDGPNRNIAGMVGRGIMSGKMILSKPHLIAGFENQKDRSNVGIHEFAHLLDATDGAYDGLPEFFLQSHSFQEWKENQKQITQDIEKGKSDMNPYAASSEIEFFAVASEYFFEDPQRMEQEKPELYQMMTRVYKQDLSKRWKQQWHLLFPKTKKTGRNQACPCQSGNKYKDCCINSN